MFAASPGLPLVPGTISMPDGTWPLTSSVFPRGRRARSTIFSSRRPGEPMIALALSTSDDAGKLYEQLIGRPAARCSAR